MRYLTMLLSLLAVVTLSSCTNNTRPDHVGVNVGIHVPVSPRLVLVPGYPVYYDPSISLNYFFYDGLYWVYSSDRWYSSNRYNGPWGIVEYRYVPMYVLRVPVRYYRQPPAYFRGWRADAPPRWDERWGRDWDKDRNDRGDWKDRDNRDDRDYRNERDNKDNRNDKDDRGDRDNRYDRDNGGDRGQPDRDNRGRAPDQAPGNQGNRAGEGYPRDGGPQDAGRSQNNRDVPRGSDTQERVKQQGRNGGEMNNRGGDRGRGGSDRGGDRQNNKR